MKPVVKKITQDDVALFLATNKRNRRKKKKGTSLDPAGDFVAEFTATNLLSILKDKRKSQVDLGWIVKKLLTLLDSEEAKVSEKIQILDRLKELIVLGAIQDKELAERISTGVSAASGLSDQDRDPFHNGKLLKIKRGA